MDDEKLEIKIEEVKKDDSYKKEEVKIDIDKIEDLSDDNGDIEELSVDVAEETKDEKKEDLKNDENKEASTKVDQVVDNKSSKKLALIITIISLIVIILIIVSLTLFFSGDKKTIVKNENGASFELNYTDKSNVLSIENAQPVADSVGVNDLTGDNYFEFSVLTEIENANKASYIVTVEKNGKKCTILDKDIRIYLEKEESGSYETVFEPQQFEKSDLLTEFNMDKGVMILNKVSTKKDTTDNYRLKIWLSDTGINSVGKNYSLKVKIYGYSE